MLAGSGALEAHAHEHQFRACARGRPAGLQRRERTGSSDLEPAHTGKKFPRVRAMSLSSISLGFAVFDDDEDYFASCRAWNRCFQLLFSCQDTESSVDAAPEFCCAGIEEMNDDQMPAGSSADSLGALYANQRLYIQVAQNAVLQTGSALRATGLPSYTGRRLQQVEPPPLKKATSAAHVQEPAPECSLIPETRVGKSAGPSKYAKGPVRISRHRRKKLRNRLTLTKAEKLVFIYQNLRAIRQATGDPCWCPNLSGIADDEQAETDDFDADELMDWWAEFHAKNQETPDFEDNNEP